MKTRELGRSGLTVSAIGLGCMGMSINYGAPRDKAEMIRLMRDAAAIVEGSGLDVTVIRPAWLNDDDEIAYGLTRKGEPFANPKATVSRASVADLIVRLVTQPAFGVGESFGVHGAHQTIQGRTS